jgi:hypothetical protein
MNERQQKSAATAQNDEGRKKQKSNKENNYCWNASAWNTQSIYLLMFFKLAEQTVRRKQQQKTTIRAHSMEYCAVEKHILGCEEAQVYAYMVIDFFFYTFCSFMWDGSVLQSR